MKKLVVLNHLGDKVLEESVFVDGQDFVYESPTPTAVWLGTILIVDQYPEPETKVKQSVAEEITEITPQLQELEEGLNQEGLTLLSRPKIVKEEQLIDTTKAGDKGTGVRRTRKAKQPESLETAPKADTKKRASKGHSRDRKPKTA